MIEGWLYRGRCWKFGDNVAIDGDMAPLSLAISRETRPEVLALHFMTGLDPNFPQKVSQGDIVVAGRRFAQGNPHIQGLLAARACGVGLVVESIPRGSLRNAVNAAVPILPNCPHVTREAETGDELEVDFEQGLFRNLTRSREARFDPLPALLLDVIKMGGWEASVRRRLDKMRSRVGP